MRQYVAEALVSAISILDSLRFEPEADQEEWLPARKVLADALDHAGWEFSLSHLACKKEDSKFQALLKFEDG